MHRAFDSEDIIYSVLKYIEPKDLKNVAMTCSRLAGPVLDILWSKQSSLVPLIMCLPQDTWEIKDDTIYLTREPTPTFHPKLSVSALVLRWLFEQFPPATLFPNLCVFDSYALRESSSDLSLIRKFISPGLESLMLDVCAPFPTHEVEQFLAVLPIEVQGLRQLLISMDDGATAFAVPPSFGKLPNLITLSIHGADVCLTR
ncbi:hypothetical protein CY34DRAFT_14106 [Suillus luteus UH-Slu-Lm8-n1]|uniref:Unplaced genomic scaffold CY34scaffold_194, whole genome shotgun sequence n=1 Tax=Suillus luteus UH-Slu-Lm8-n1 TaxID=930992 RepID=A0A0D0ADV6_9AGAM|nr:hypothetical protein CY34DRAFT_14106 [Suillus luteus UH-Slu-Lm8-n1]